MKSIVLEMPKVLIQLLNHDLPLDMVFLSFFSNCSLRSSYRWGNGGKNDSNSWSWRVIFKESLFTSLSMSKKS